MKAMKSQAIAFLLGFGLTSLVLLFLSGMGKKTSQASHPNDQKSSHDQVSFR